MAQFRANDVGSVFYVTVTENGSAFDLSDATEITLKLRKPDGSVLERAAVLYNDGTDGLVFYITVDGDLDTPGNWLGQLYVALVSGHWNTDMFAFPVGEAL